MAMSEGDNARGGATSEVRGRAFMVAMVFGPAVSTAPIIGAVAGFMSRVLAMAFEAIDMRGEGAFSLAKRIPWRGPWVLHPSTLQTIFTFTFSRIVVRRSLCRKDARDDAGGRAPWSGAHQMVGQSCPDCCMGEIPLHFVLLFLSFQLLSS